MPWMALAPDISGVCSVEETLEITSMPTKTLRTKIVSQTTASLMRCSPSIGPARAAGRLVPDRAVVGHARAGDDLVLEVRGEGPALVRAVIRVTRLTTFWA